MKSYCWLSRRVSMSGSLGSLSSEEQDTQLDLNKYLVEDREYKREFITFAFKIQKRKDTNNQEIRGSINGIQTCDSFSKSIISYIVKRLFVHFTSSKLTIKEHTRLLTQV
jgi:hypothetical protein